MSAIEMRIAALEARVAELESGKGGGATASPKGGGDALPDAMLENSWAQKTIKRDPKQWKGRPQVGRTYAQAPVEWLEMMANNLDYKADCGRKEVPVRVNEKGKPWHESDTFEAKLCRAWARRNASKPKTPTAKPADDDDFGFGHNAADDDAGFG